MQVSYTCHLYWPHITKNLYCASFLAWLYMRVPWKARRSNQSILKEINPEYSLEGLILKLKLQYFSHLTRRANSLEKILMLGKIDSRRKRAQQRMRWLDGITDSMNMNSGKLWEMVRDREASCDHEVTQLDMTGWLNNSNNMLYGAHYFFKKYFKI